MNNSWLLIIFGAATIYFSIQTLRIFPTLFRLLVALKKRTVKWPGPRIHDLSPSANIVKERFGIGYNNLFSDFIWNTSGVIAAFVYSTLMLLSSNPLMTGYIRFKSVSGILILSLISFAGARFTSKKALNNVIQVNSILSDFANKVDPRGIDGQYTKAEYVRESRQMKTYRNEKYGFEIDIPNEWELLPSAAYEMLSRASSLLEPGHNLGNRECFQFGCFNEAANFEIGPLFPKRLLDYTELEFRGYAKKRGFTDLEFGRIIIGGEEHVWARYHIRNLMGKRWNKKYMIVFSEMEHTITCTCNDPLWFAQREKDWDVIMTSFRFVNSQDQFSYKQTIQAKEITTTPHPNPHQASKGKRFNLTFPQYYEQESMRVLGDKCNLILMDSLIEATNNSAHIRLVYKWRTKLSFEDAFKLKIRTSAYVACAIYDAAINVGLTCQPYRRVNNQKPSWLVGNETKPTTLTQADYKFSSKICVFEIGYSLKPVSFSHEHGNYWMKLLDGFKSEFSDIEV